MLFFTKFITFSFLPQKNFVLISALFPHNFSVPKSRSPPICSFFGCMAVPLSVASRRFVRKTFSPETFRPEKNAKSLQRSPKSAKGCHKLPKVSLRIPQNQNSLRMPKKTSDYLRIHQNSLRMPQNASECFRIHQNISEYLRIRQNTSK